MIKGFRIIQCILFVWLNTSYSQEKLTLEKSIQTALQKNYDVLISKNQLEISKSQNNIGNAGLSPTVSINSNLNLSNLNSYQEFNNGTTQDRDGAKSSGFNASLNASWTIFDGLRMFAIKKRLNQNEQLSAMQLKQQIEQLVFDVMVAYYNCVKVQKLIQLSQQNLRLYEERKKLADLKFEIGSTSKTDLLLASTEINQVKSNLLQLEIQLLSSKVSLANLMNTSSEIDFEAIDSMSTNLKPNLIAIKQTAGQKNSSLLMSRQNEEILKQTLKETKANALPFLQLNTGYTFMRNQSEAGFVFLNRQNGINASLVAGWTIFNGGRNNKLTKEREINLLNQKYVSEQTLQSINSQVFVQTKTYLLSQEMMQLENQNLKDAFELYQIAVERYNTGKSNFIETLEMQRRYEDAQMRYTNALFSSKMAETELLRVSGELVK